MGKRSWIVENKWKCYSCSSPNRGRDMKCSVCGSPKEKVETYELGDVSAPVKDTQKLTQANAGPNWSCDFCFNDNRADLSTCGVCGAPRASASEFSSTPHRASTIVPPPRESRRPSRTTFPDTPRAKLAGSDRLLLSKKEGWRRYAGPVALSAIVVFVFSSLLFFFSKREITVRVKSTSWTYVRVLEQRNVRSGSGWGHPSDSFNVSCSRRQRGTEDCNPRDCRPHSVSYDCRPHDCACHVHCVDLNNGYSRCEESCSTCYDTCTRTEYDTCYDQCPVYDDWCTYNYHTWDKIDEETTSGSTDPYWGSRLSADHAIPQRIMSTESYGVVFSDDGDEWSYSPENLREFSSFSKDDMWRVDVNYAGMVWPRRRISTNL